MPKKNEWLSEFVDDWNVERGYHGFARVELTPEKRYYSVRLSVRGQQHEISRHKSQHEAARAYDLALYRLLAFAPLCAKPNFADAFNTILLSDVERVCPYAQELYLSTREDLKQAGINPDTLEEQRHAKLAPLKSTTSVSQCEEYAALRVRMNRISVETHAHYVKLTELIEQVRLTKFLELNRAVVEAEVALSRAVTTSNNARTELAQHAEVFAKYKRDGLI